MRWTLTPFIAVRFGGGQPLQKNRGEQFMVVKNDTELRAAASLLVNRIMGLCNSKTVEETLSLMDESCDQLTEIVKYKVTENENNRV